RRFLHSFISGIDYNRSNSPQPVIPKCSSSTQANDLTAVCSLGSITFDNTSGIAQYKGLLVRLEKRFSHRTQLLASYALGSDKGRNGAGGQGVAATGFNNFNWFENYGPLLTDICYILYVSGLFDMSWLFN